jgi:hypothetical protein
MVKTSWTMQIFTLFFAWHEKSEPYCIKMVLFDENLGILYQFHEF